MRYVNRTDVRTHAQTNSQLNTLVWGLLTLAQLTLGAHAQRGVQYSVCVCVSFTSLTATPLTYRYKVRYESKANAVLKVFDSWILLKILC